MSQVPALCGTCGLIFPSPIALAPDARDVVLANVTINCPRCGGRAAIADGVYNLIGDTLHILVTAPIGRSRLQSLAEALEAARKRHASTDEVKATINEHVPELQKIADVLPRTRNELYAFLGILITVIAILLSLRQPATPEQGKQVTPEQVQAIVDKAVAQAASESAQSKTNDIVQPTPQSAPVPNRAQRRAQQSKARRKQPRPSRKPRTN